MVRRERTERYAGGGGGGGMMSGHWFPPHAICSALSNLPRGA